MRSDYSLKTSSWHLIGFLDDGSNTGSTVFQHQLLFLFFGCSALFILLDAVKSVVVQC